MLLLSGLERKIWFYQYKLYLVVTREEGLCGISDQGGQGGQGVPGELGLSDIH